MMRSVAFTLSLGVWLSTGQAVAQEAVPVVPVLRVARPPAPPPGPVPQPALTPQGDCGLTDASATFGELQVGSVVTLQRHRAVRGETNFHDDMVRFLGREARVTRLSGVDSEGCPGVRVEIDGGRFFWRVRDLGTLAATTAATGPATPAPVGTFPQECHQQEGRESYGAARPGMTVTLRRHRSVEGDDNWGSPMEAYIGRVARIVAPVGVDGVGCPGVRLDIDGGEWFWRIRDLVPLGGDASFSTEPSTGVAMDHGRLEVGGVGDGLFANTGVLGPQACGQSDRSVQWGGLAVGTEVTLGRHRPVEGDDNWDEGMSAFVGRTGRVTELIGVDDRGCPLVHVDVDQGQWFWRARDLVIAAPPGSPAAPPSPATASPTPVE